jgi:hypothetical protein
MNYEADRSANLRPRKSSLSLLLLALVWAIGHCSAAQAGLVLSVSNTTYLAGSSSNGFDVNLTNTGTTPADDFVISSFAFELTTVDPSVTFLQVNTSTIGNPYIFAGHSFFEPDITLAISADGFTISASDLFATPLAGVLLASGQTLGLGHVVFALNADATGFLPPIFADYPATSFSGPNPTNIPSVPEPLSMGLGLQAMIVSGLGFGYCRMRRCKQ